MADAFGAVRVQAAEAAKRGGKDRGDALRKLDPRQRRLLELFKKQEVATAEEMAVHLRLSHRTVVGLSRGWLKTGFLELHEPSRKRCSYQLGGVSAVRGGMVRQTQVDQNPVRPLDPSGNLDPDPAPILHFLEQAARRRPGVVGRGPFEELCPAPKRASSRRSLSSRLVSV